MGLDMFLYRSSKPKEFEEIGYWRKANAVFDWINNNVRFISNCSKLRMSKKNIERLLDVCKQARDIIQSATTQQIKIKVGYNVKEGIDIFGSTNVYDENTADKLSNILPTCTGFFFGSTEYDEYYLSYIEYTIKICEEILKTTDFKTQRIFFEAWW